MSRSSALIRTGTVLDNRYKIVRELGRGGFGRTYLAEDTYRYNEKCVLKEFAPQVESQSDLRKAEELFQREAGILYKLRHDRIPKFEALLRTRIDGKESLFLVQEYIDGYSYWELVDQGKRFSETEVVQLLLDILPVLEYIHSLKLIHRDISPDNLIQRRSDGKPVLIDFGCVKVAANAVSRSSGYSSVTVVGKKGYAPEEQMRQGRAYPSSDLYSLAVTVLVLLSGKSPQELYDSYHAQWKWRREVRVSSNLARVLDKMLAYNPGDRYQDAAKVIQVLQEKNYSLIGSIISRIRTVVVSPRNDREPSQISKIVSNLSSTISRIKTQALRTAPPSSASRSDREQRFRFRRIAIIGASAILLPGIVTFAFVNGLISQLNPSVAERSPDISLSEKERERQSEIYERLQALNFNEGVFYAEVDQIFYEKYPELKEIQLTDRPEHQKYREEWYEMAEDLLKQKERLDRKFFPFNL